MNRKFENSHNECAVWDIMKLYQDDLCRSYILLFQERNFYRHYYERIRKKPESALWKIWFGNQLCYGPFIAPIQLPDNTWRIDHSEIRRAKYKYWTISHIFAVRGLINAENNMDDKISNLDDLEQFYIHLVQSLSNFQYEKGICEKYIAYLKSSSNIMEEPFLIPEFHYEGPTRKCRYRLDFMVLNPYTFQYTGFEL